MNNNSPKKMSESEFTVPLQNEGTPKSYSSMDKKCTGEILNVISDDEKSDEQRSSALKGELKINQVRDLATFSLLQNSTNSFSLKVTSEFYGSA